MSGAARNTILFLLLLAAMWLSSLWLYDAHKMQHALQWREAVLNGQSPFDWTFDTRSDITSGHGIETFEWRGGEILGELNDPYIYLNLRGRYIDTHRYTRLRISLRSIGESHLQLFHHQGSDTVIHFSNTIPVGPGMQAIELNLENLHWQSRNVYQPAATARPSRWGSPEGIVTALRIDPVLEGGFAVDRVELFDPEPAGLVTDDSITFHTPDDPALDALDRDAAIVPLLAHDRFLRTPETAHATRMAIAERLPSAVLFPKPPGDKARAAWPAGLLPGILFVLALLVYSARKQLPADWRGAAQIGAFLLMLLSFLFLEPILNGWLKLIPLLPLGFAAWQLRPAAGNAGWPGDPAAWKYLAPLIAVALLSFLFYEHHPGGSPLWQVLATYLGWALIQQYLVAGVVFTHLRSIAGPLAVVLSAAAFGFMHLPNFALMVSTFVLGLYLLAVYDRHPNLPALALTHALAAVGLNQAATGLLWLSREIGPRFLESL